METCRDIATLRSRLGADRRAGRRIAFVPTMGALHEGHLALVDAARSRGDVVVLSIFVNPLQFGPAEDLARYPRPIERDAALAAGRGVDVLFAPTTDTMYAEQGSEVRVDPGVAATRWEGAVRPGHFAGVLTVVAKLFNIVQPDVAIFGQKDIQQVVLIRRMVSELDFPVAIHVVPTVRESDGLALSSRNVYLDADQRRDALVLSAALRAVASAWRSGVTDAATLRRTAEAVIATVPAVVADYIAIADPARLEPVETASAGSIVAVAARVGSTRLIDNVILDTEAG